jgi:hypothetical protein
MISFRERAGRSECLSAFLICAAGALLFMAPALRRIDAWGIGDWDQHQFLYGVSRWAIADKGEWPFWNPFACGGGPLLADPQSPAFYPLFAFVLLFGVVPGLKILIAIHAALGSFGAWLFARRLGCGALSAWLPAAAYGCSSAYALHLATGHATWMAMAYAPLALAALHAGFERLPRAGLAGAAAAMIVFLGNGYLLVYLFVFAGIWAACESIATRSWRPLLAVAVMGLSASGIAAVKILPFIDFAGRVTSSDVADASGGGPVLIWHALLGRDQSLGAYEGLHSGQAWRWWEYGAYVGPVVPFLAALYAFRRFRCAWTLLAPAAAAILLALGSGWGIWDLLRAMPGFAALRVPSRGIVFAVLFLGTMAGLQIAEWEARVPRALLAAAIAIAALDIGWVGRASFSEAFVVEPRPVASPGDFHQRIGRKDFTKARDPVSGRYTSAYTDMYPAFLSGIGTVNCYDRFHLPVAAQPSALPAGGANPRYRGEAWIAGEGDARLTEIGGDRITVEIDGAARGSLVVNQNFDDGWRAGDGRPVVAREGLLSVEVAAADRVVVLRYTPPGFFAGAALSLLASAVVVGMLLRDRRR